MLYKIWSEGYAASGDRGDATYHGTIEAKSFQEACDKLADKDVSFRRNYNRERMTFWGCRLFDNEADARKLFG